MKCLKGCDIDGVRYEPGDDLPDLSAADEKWLAAKGVIDPPAKKGKK